MSVHDEDNVRKVIEKELPRYITIIIKSSSWTHDRYIPCLNLIARLANASVDAAAIFMDVFVGDQIELPNRRECEKQVRLFRDFCFIVS